MLSEDHGPATGPGENLTPEQMQLVCNLVSWIVQENQSFKVYPPPEVTSDPDVLQSDAILDRLRGTKWRLTAADGRQQVLSFIELMVFLHNLTVLRAKLQELQGQGSGPPGPFDISFEVNVARIMTREGVRALLSTLNVESASG